MFLCCTIKLFETTTYNLNIYECLPSMSNTWNKISDWLNCINKLMFYLAFSNQAILRFLAMWRHTDPGPSHDCGLTWPFYLRPALSELSSVRIVSMLERLQTRMAPKWCVLLLDVIMNIAVVIYSWHLIHWRRSGLCLFLKGMHLPICLNVSMFVQIRVGPIYDAIIHRRWVSLAIISLGNYTVYKLRTTGNRYLYAGQWNCFWMSALILLSLLRCAITRTPRSSSTIHLQD